MQAQYKRVMLKISGEALSGDKGFGLEQSMLKKVASEVAKIVRDYNVEVSIVIGGGNFWRGAGKAMDRTRADHMGMLATVINSLALQDALEKESIQTRVMSAIDMQKIAESYIRNKAIRHLKKGRVVIFACGTGNPFFSTDTAAALRAAEIEADLILLAKNVDGVYSADPKIDAQAKKYDKISYLDILNQNLRVMDATATTLCMDNEIPILVFGLNDENSICRAVCGEKIGTIVEK